MFCLILTSALLKKSHYGSILFTSNRKKLARANFVKTFIKNCYKKSQLIKDRNCSIVIQIAVFWFHRIHLWVFLQLRKLDFWLFLVSWKVSFTSVRNYVSFIIYDQKARPSAVVNMFIFFNSFVILLMIFCFYQSEEIHFYLLTYLLTYM